MRLRAWPLGLLILALVFSASGVLAQSGEQTYEGLFTITYPDHWQVRATNANQVQLFEDEATITFYGPERVARLRALAPDESDAEFLARFLDSLSLRVVEAIPAEGNLLAGASLQPTRKEAGTAALLTAGDGLQVVAVLRAADDVHPTVLPDFQAIIASLVPGPIPSTVTLDSAVAEAAERTPVPTPVPVVAEPCTVSAAEANAATVRVGPGENRTAITFLPAGTAFSVLGEATANDESLWWKLDKAQVAPQSAAAELWVAQDDVTASGDCAAVGAADAPPIIPITAPQPASGSGGGSAGGPSGGPVASSGGGRAGVFITLPEWQAGLPPSLQASSAARARVIVNIVNMSFSHVENCGDYVNSINQHISINRVKVVYTAEAIDGVTGQPLGPAGIFEGGDPPGCPSSILINSTLNGPPPTVDAAIPWLQSLLGM